MSKRIIGLLLLVIGFGFRAWSVDSATEVTGSMRVRAESKSTTDYTHFVGSRIRVEAKFKPNDRVNIFLQPQFAKAWGEPEFVPTSATANVKATTSGSTNDTGIDLHQGYLQYLISDSISVTMGRKELNYGDQLLVGGLGWSNVGRSFDTFLGSYKYSFGVADLFSAKVYESNSSGGGIGDKDFSGAYFSNNLGDWLQNADVYAFLSEDRSTTVNTATAAYGARVKSAINGLDYRLEGTIEDVKGATQQSGAEQWDVELGYEIIENKMLRLSGEYFYASENFDQLYPTGHKWLGYADLFSRRNIKGYRLGASSQLSEDFNVAIDYHDFQRAETGASAYKLAGGTYGTVGTDQAIAREVDVVLGYKFSGGVVAELGACQAEPQAYLKANGVGNSLSFYYLQVNTPF